MLKFDFRDCRTFISPEALNGYLTAQIGHGESTKVIDNQFYNVGIANVIFQTTCLDA
jgi:hypothetical protein